MSVNSDRLRQNVFFLVISLLTLLTYLALYLFRSLDDNRLTSWQSAFSFSEPEKIFFFLTAGIIAARLLSKFSFPERRPAFFLFVSSFAVAIAFWGEPEVIIDASRYFTQAKHLEVYGIGYFLREWGKEISVWTDMPAVPFLYGLIFKMLGEKRIFIEAFTTFLFSITVLLTYLIGKKLWDAHTGFFAGILLLGIPYLFSQVSLMLVDVPFMCFLLFSIFTFILALEEGGAMIPVSSAAIFLTFFTKYSAWLVLSVLPVITIIFAAQRRKPNARRYLYRSSFTFVLTALLIGAVMVCKWDVIAEQVRFLIAYQKPGLKRWGESFVSTFFFQVHPFITAAAVYSVYAAFKKKDLKYVIIIWLPLLAVVLQVRRIRYIFIVFPLLCLMASYGIMRVRELEKIKFVSFAIAIFSIIIAVFAYLPFLQKISLVNLKDGGAFLNTLKGEDVEVVTLPSGTPVANLAVSVPILDLYTEKRIRYDYRASPYADRDEILISPLRFTWEFRNPEYYQFGPAKSRSAPVVVISNEPGDILPPNIKQKISGFDKMKTFRTSENIFNFQTLLTIYYK
jgi:hypothetical protein